EGGVAGVVSGEGRREIGAVAVVGRGAQRLPVRIGGGGGVAVGGASADGGDRPPEIVDVFHVPGGEAGVGHRQVDQGEEAGILHHAVAHLPGDDLSDLVVQARRRAEA